MCEVENVEFNSDGALGITVYHDQKKGSASTSDLSEKAIAQTVAAALDIAQYTSEDPFAGPAPKEYMVKEIPDLDLFHWRARSWLCRWDCDCCRRDKHSRTAIESSKVMAQATTAIMALRFMEIATVY